MRYAAFYIGALLVLASSASFAAGPIRVIVWDERQPDQKRAYENFLGNAIADYLRGVKDRKGAAEFDVRSVGIDDPEQGLSPESLDSADVLVWWGHVRHNQISEAKAKDIVRRVKAGRLSFLALHSAHWARPFIEAMNERTIDDALKSLPPGERSRARVKTLPPPPGMSSPDHPPNPSWTRIPNPDGTVTLEVRLPSCVFPAVRNDAKPSHVTTVSRRHPIAKDVPERFDIPETEMYAEPFHVPNPDAVIFEERWDAGEWFRGGCVWNLGAGKVFYFRPGHETYPIFKQPIPLKIVENAARWLGEDIRRKKATSRSETGVPVVIGAGAVSVQSGQASVSSRTFGKLEDGTPIEQYTLTNRHGLMARIMTYGATLTELHLPDRTGKLADVVLGFDNLEQYLKGHPFFGSTTGRVANRIAGGKFTLDGKDYQLAVNSGTNHIHGGLKGIDKRVWRAKPIWRSDSAAVEFRYLSPDGEEGYPGNLDLKVVYTLADDNALEIEYTAKSDKPTLVNLTNHSYVNLAGSGDVLGHELLFNARLYTPLNENTVPTGEVRFVEGTPFDFRSPHTLGERITQPPLESTLGYDHNFVLDGPPGKLKLMARAHEPKSGRIMEVWTTEPGVQLYTANHLNGSLVGKGGIAYGKHAGFCLEAQHFPDAPNKPHFPSIVLRPGETYRQTTVHKFSAK